MKRFIFVKMKKYIFILLSILVLSSCKKDTTNVNLHYDYFGAETGKYIVYDVKEISHLSNYTKDTINYQLKTVIGDTVHDNSSRIGYKFKRYKRNLPTENWVLKDVWFIIIAENKGELIEENERIIKLVFAPKENKVWNGNAFNTKEEVEYSYEDIHSSMDYNGFHLDSTLKVVQEDVFNMIQYRNKYEVYAKGIGLVKKNYQHLNISNFDVTNISTGKEIFYEMIEYGNE